MANSTHQTSRQKLGKRTTLNPAYSCNDCDEPAMVYEGVVFYCPKCYLKKEGQQIKGLDHSGYYP